MKLAEIVAIALTVTAFREKATEAFKDDCGRDPADDSELTRWVVDDIIGPAESEEDKHALAALEAVAEAVYQKGKTDGRRADGDAFVTVPITQGFDSSKASVGFLTIERAALPPTPGFVFNIGYQALGPVECEPGKAPSAPYAGPYELGAVSVVTDGDYANYLRQIGVVPG